jgi:Hypothetical glycosyl hydrolase family 15
MASHVPRRTLTAALAAIVALLCAAAPSAASDGKLNFERNATSAFDSVITGATATVRGWMASHYYRMRGYPPFFDQALSWAPPSDFYFDLYAIYSADRTDGMPDRDLLAAHPDWVLRDASQNRLYIPWDCSGGSCPQYAADIGNPGWRSYWISQARAQLAKGYRGIFIDDVNMEMRVGNGSGAFVRPTDPRTGQPMTDSDWRRYVAEFAEEIKAAFPSAEIVHNAIWWAPHSDRSVQREIDAADVVQMERGFNDPGIVGGSGTFGYQTYLDHVDWLHSRGSSVVYQPYGLNPTSREFELASYFLVQGPGDAIASDYQADPSNWWPGWDADLGSSAGGRYQWNALWRRDFAGGMVLVNEPGAQQKTVTLPPGNWTDLAGDRVTSVTLGPRQGKVLFGQGGGGGGGTTVTLKSKKPRVIYGTAISLTGRTGASSVAILRRSHGKWRRLLGRVKVVHGRYHVSVPARRRGSQRFRARTVDGAESNVARVRVRHA